MRGEYGLELDAWARAKAATKRITSRGRPPQQEEPDWETDRDGVSFEAGGTPSPEGMRHRDSEAGMGCQSPSATFRVAPSTAAVRVVADLEGAS